MKVAKYIDGRIKNMLNNPHSTQGYPKTAQGNPCTLQDPSITPIKNAVFYGNSIQDGTPTPEIPVAIQNVGKKSINLVNHNAVYAHSSAPSSLKGAIITDEYVDITRQEIYSYGNIPISLKAGKTYTAWYEVEVYEPKDENKSPSPVKIGFYEKPSIITRLGVTTRIITYTPVEDIDTYMCLWANFGGSNHVKARFKVMVLEGEYTESTIPDFEPYSGDKYFIPIKVQEKNSTTGEVVGVKTVNIYLDEPLRKAGEYADYIDWEKGVVKRFIGVYKIPNSKTWADWKVNGNRVQLYMSGLKKTEGDTLGFFTAGESVQSVYDEEPNHRTKRNKIYASENNMTVYWYPDYTAMGLDGTEDKATADEKLQAWLATIPLKQFEYVLATPVEIPIDLPSLSIIPHQTNIINTETVIKGDITVNYHSFNREE